MNVFCDTSVLVASAVREHVHHARALPVVQRVLQGKDRGIVAGHGLAETYAVLTSLPVVPRIGPESARKLVVDNVIDHFEIVVLTAKEYVQVIAASAERQVAGGAVYDAILLRCALKCGADRIYTFNVGEFRRLAPDLADRIAAP